ncbi:amino acid/amide ABC transporter substrate-binding protein (HAAT family) [Enterovirga rhinocerotis]|uniref:Amino acid/amide ABC transporter substrate-binding protein (HAAT family) n=2 Tax=Enterovirga rhinocerotis TaxID=1339210 RepID=A0A4R7C973_9HYPH|nr:amino acid/amide ABC transporter substrate-binding protein (HAAT family) [Enterovirga rhinocerotis]
MKRKTLTAAVAVTALLAGGSAFAQVPVKLGVLNDMSGLYADISGPGSVVAARLAVEDFKPESKGIKVEIVSADHQNKPDVGSTIARKWYDQDGVDVILDVTTSSVALAVSDVTKEKNKIFMISGGGTSDLTGAKCTANNVHWTYDTWALANGTGSAVTKAGGDSWFMLTADYAFGAALDRDTSEAVKKAGGKIVGSVKHPLSTADFSSFLLQAQASKAKVIGMANAGSDTINTIKQAAEFGITQSGQSLAGLLIFSSDVKSLGLQAAQGLKLTEAFYWDQTDATRAFSKRFAAAFGGKMPTSAQAGVYSSVLHYLKAVEALKDKDTTKVMAKMKELPIDDALFGKGSIRVDGRAIHPMYLYEVKKPEESKGEWDMYKVVATIPTEEAFRPLKDGGCPLVK